MKELEPGKVEVTLQRDRTTDRYFFGIELCSGVREGNLSWSALDPKTPSLEQAMMVAGAALAEHQNELHGDQHDPEEVARRTGEAFRELCSDLRQRGVL